MPEHRDGPSFWERVQQRFSQTPERQERTRAAAEETSNKVADEVAGLMDMVKWLGQHLRPAPGGLGLTLTPETYAEVGEILQTIAEHPAEMARGVVDLYREDFKETGGLSMLADAQIGGLPLLLRIGRAAKVIRAGGALTDVKKAFNATEAVADVARTTEAAQGPRMRAAFRDPMNAEIIVPETRVHDLGIDSDYRVFDPTTRELGEVQQMDIVRSRRIEAENATRPEVAGFLDTQDSKYLTREETARVVNAPGQGESSVISEAETVYDIVSDPDDLIMTASALAAEAGQSSPGAVQTYVELLARELGFKGMNDRKKVTMFKPLPKPPAP